MSYAALEAMGFLGPPKRNPHGCGYLPPPMGVYLSHCRRAHEGERAIGANLIRFEHPEDGSCPCCPVDSDTQS